MFKETKLKKKRISKWKETLEFNNFFLLSSLSSWLWNQVSESSICSHKGSDPEADSMLDTSQVKENIASTLETYSLSQKDNFKT